MREESVILVDIPEGGSIDTGFLESLGGPSTAPSLLGIRTSSERMSPSGWRRHPSRPPSTPRSYQEYRCGPKSPQPEIWTALPPRLRQRIVSANPSTAEIGTSPPVRPPFGRCRWLLAN